MPVKLTALRIKTLCLSLITASFTHEFKIYPNAPEKRQKYYNS